MQFSFYLTIQRDTRALDVDSTMKCPILTFYLQHNSFGFNGGIVLANAENVESIIILHCML